jgi:hypothetical protein
MKASVILVLVGVVALVGIAGFAAASSIGHNGSVSQATGSNGVHQSSGGSMMDGHGGGSGNMNDWNHQWSNTCSNGSESCGCSH